MNSLTAISRAMPDAIHGAPMRPATAGAPAGLRIAAWSQWGRDESSVLPLQPPQRPSSERGKRPNDLADSQTSELDQGPARLPAHLVIKRESHPLALPPTTATSHPRLAVSLATSET